MQTTNAVATRILGQVMDGNSRLLIFKEKHGVRYFLVKTVDDVAKACSKIFKERLENCWYISLDEWKADLEKAKAKLETHCESLKVLKAGSENNSGIAEFAKMEEKKVSEAQRNVRQLEREIEMFSAAIANPEPGPAVVAYIREHGDAEYEGYEFEELEEL